MPEVTAPNPNPTPKTRFQQMSTRVRIHNEMMHRDDLQASLDFALLEMQRRLAQRTDAAGSHYMMAGAVEFIDILKNLGEVQATQKRIDHDNLPGNK